MILFAAYNAVKDLAAAAKTRHIHRKECGEYDGLYP